MSKVREHSQVEQVVVARLQHALGELFRAPQGQLLSFVVLVQQLALSALLGPRELAPVAFSKLRRSPVFGLAALTRVPQRPQNRRAFGGLHTQGMATAYQRRRRSAQVVHFCARSLAVQTDRTQLDRIRILAEGLYGES
jgi:hypothetical protein